MLKHHTETEIDKESIIYLHRLERAQGSLLGQLAGDALGGMVEFKSSTEIRALFPDGIQRLEASPVWNTLPGQPTDDSEMALALARMLLREGTYNKDSAREAYCEWLNSNPFDFGLTTASGLRAKANAESEANGAMMRISPLGIFGASLELDKLASWAMEDARITHPNIKCQKANALFAMAIARAVSSTITPSDLYGEILLWAKDMDAGESLQSLILRASDSKPADYLSSQGWVEIAFQNALFQLLHAPDAGTAISYTVMQGGDTDTNAAICGALLGAVHGIYSLPAEWCDTILKCRPEAGLPGVQKPRPRDFWPVDALEIARDLVDYHHFL